MSITYTAAIRRLLLLISANNRRIWFWFESSRFTAISKMVDYWPQRLDWHYVWCTEICRIWCVVVQTEIRAVKKFSNSRLIMNSRQLWNSYQRNKFLRAEASREILKFRVSEMAFPGVFKRYFRLWMLRCFFRILATLGTIPSKCCRHSTTSHGSNVSQI